LRIGVLLLHNVTGRWKIALGFLLLSLASAGVYSLSSANFANQVGASPAGPLQIDDEAAIRAWLAVKQRERGKFTKVAEGAYVIQTSPALGSSLQATQTADVWILSKLESGQYLAEGNFRSKGPGGGSDTAYQIHLDAGMRPVAYKIFGKKLVSGCLWTKARFYCQETDHSGGVDGAAGAAIDGSTKFLSPLFPFLFNGLAPNSKLESTKPGYLVLLSLSYSDDPTALIDLAPQYGSINFVRRTTYSLLEADFAGTEFQLDVREMPNARATRSDAPVIPPDSEHKDAYKPFCRFIVSSDGILLSASDATTQKEFIRLMHFKKFADF
jgi:hypothetical protein